MTPQTLHVWVYRNLENRRRGEPDDGSLAWQAHRERERVLREAVEELELTADWDAARALTDQKRPHELAELVVEFVKEPTVAKAVGAGAAYVIALVGQQLDQALGNLVGRLFGKLFSAFKEKRTADFWLELPDGSRVQVDANGTARLTFKNGKLVTFQTDSPPEQAG
jgi:hypothetical protein